MSASDRIWLKGYPPGVPAEIDVTQYKSLVHLLEEAFRKHAAAPAYSCMGTTMSFRDLDEQSAAIGAWLQSQGLTKGQRVAIMMPNVLQYPVVLAGIRPMGPPPGQINPLYSTRDRGDQLKDSGPAPNFIFENFETTF